MNICLTAEGGGERVRGGRQDTKAKNHSPIPRNLKCARAWAGESAPGVRRHTLTGSR